MTVMEHLTSFGIEFQTEDERSPSVVLLCAGLLRSGMVYELERVLRVCNGFLCSMSANMMVQYCCGSSNTNKLFCRCFLF